jgi:hypothetical protein
MGMYLIGIIGLNSEAWVRRISVPGAMFFRTSEFAQPSTALWALKIELLK